MSAGDAAVLGKERETTEVTRRIVWDAFALLRVLGDRARIVAGA
jgi:hypothetical protein